MSSKAARGDDHPTVRRRIFGHSPAKSSANAAHGARGRDEVRFTDVMTSLLLPNHLLNPIGNLFIGTAIAQQRAQILFNHAEQTSPNLTVSRQPDAIAMPAERFCDRGDHANLTASIGKKPTA